MNWWQIITTILGSSTISTLITYLLNRRFNNKKLHAEIISKSRIDWINEFRALTSKYIYETYKSIEEGKLACHFEKLAKASKKGSYDKKRYEDAYNKHIEKYNECVSNMTKYFIQIRLYLPNRSDGTSQEEHKKIKEDIKSISKELNDAINMKNEEQFLKIQRVDTQLLVDYIAQYLKTEWEKAKNKK